MLKFDTHTWSFQLYRRHSTIQRVEYHGKAVIHTSYFIFASIWLLFTVFLKQLAPAVW